MASSAHPHEERALLRAAGLRVTRPRLAVLASVAARPHSDVDAIAAGTRRLLGSVSTQAVYDVLQALTGAGLLRHVEPAGSPARYERRVADNHHHVVCRRCGAMRDVDCVLGPAPCLQVSDDHGFVIDEAEVTFWGLCPDCRPAGHPRTPDPHGGRTQEGTPPALTAVGEARGAPKKGGAPKKDVEPEEEEESHD